MDLDEQLEQAQIFLDYYVLGAGAPRAAQEFPGSTHAGIVLRRPAVLDIRPEYTPQPHPLNGTQVAAGEDGPEGLGPYVFLDRCALRRARVINVNGQLVIRLLCVTRYPPNRYVDVHPSVVAAASPPRNEEVRLPVSGGELQLIARECAMQLEDYLGTDPEATPNLGCRVEVLTFDEFNATEG